jgi:hypothetical protein
VVLTVWGRLLVASRARDCYKSMSEGVMCSNRGGAWWIW